MNDSKALPTVTEIIDGPVTSIDRVYAFDRLRDVCRAAPRGVRRVRTRLTAPPQPTPDWQAAAEGTLLLDGDLIVCAGVTATTMREAIDLLMTRLRYRLRRLAETKRGSADRQLARERDLVRLRQQDPDGQVPVAADGEVDPRGDVVAGPDASDRDRDRSDVAAGQAGRHLKLVHLAQPS